MEITFREASEADLPAAVALLADDLLGREREDASLPLDAAYLAAFREMRAQGGNRLIVAEVQGSAEDGGARRIVGCLQLVVLPGISLKGTRRAQIEGVRVAGDLRGAGLGRRLLEHAVDLARAEGCGLLQLTANAARSDTHRFYESLGFTASHLGFKLKLD
jgi:GNAT superfamily N-acetyltransferase